MDKLKMENEINDNAALVSMTYFLEIFGCQMNESDGERVCGLLEQHGCIPVSCVEQADIVVFLTCCVREKADTRLFGQVASIKNIPPAHSKENFNAQAQVNQNALGKRYVAVGGCIGQRDGELLRKQLPNVDIVFGTHNLQNLPALLCKCIETKKPVAETFEDGSVSDIDEKDAKRLKPWHAWLPIMKGCNNFCSYCIVPYVRGRQSSKNIESIKYELEKYAAQGVQEVTLLGQNVNSYGQDLYGEPRFAEILHIAGKTDIPRIRFVTSHPKDLSPETIEAFAMYDNIMPQLHLPAQSGSDKVLKEMNRGYSSKDYLQLVYDLKSAIPDISLSTDIIVGFPTETSDDFEQTYNLVKEVGYGQVFTFIYSKRSGTPAAEMQNVSSKEEIQERFDKLVDLVQASAYEQNQKEKDCTIDVLFEDLSKRDKKMLAGKSPKNQTVHVALPQNSDPKDFFGKILPVHISNARTWYLQGELT